MRGFNSTPHIDELLAYLDPNCPRDQWVRIAMACKREDEGSFDVFDAWSSRGDSYSLRACQDVWRQQPKEGGATLGTLIHLARQNGYGSGSTPTPIKRSGRAAPQTKPKKQPTVAADIAEWHSLPEQGFSAYLANKGVADVPCSAIRYGARYISVLIQAFDDNGGLVERGTQKIFAQPFIDRKGKRQNKIYSTGLDKRGAFVVLGNIADLPGGAVIIEGLSTGLSPKKAGARLVICALDAGNLEPVVESIRTHYPDAPLTIAADNDAFTKGNPGITKARDAAIKHGCSLAVPDFTGLDLTSKPTDFNDLHHLAGLDAVRLQVRNAARPLLTPSPFEAMQGVTYKRVHDFDKVTLEPGVTLFKGFEGSGKTKRAVQLLVENVLSLDSSIVATCHRVSLTDKITTDLKAAGITSMAFYQDKDFDIHSPQQGICSRSLFRWLQLLEQGIMPDVLFIDEIQQVLRDLVHAKMDYKPAVFYALETIVKHAKYVLGADAGIDETTVKFIQRVREDETITIYESAVSLWRGRPVVVYDDKEHWLNRLKRDMNAGKRIVIGSNSRKRVRKLKALCEQNGWTCLAIHSDSSGGESQQDFIKNASVESMKYQIIIYSPSIGTGVSIENDHFDVVYLDFADWLTSDDCVQIALRYRQNVPMHVYIDSGSRKPETDKERIKRSFIDAPKHDSALISWNGTERGILNVNYEALYLDVHAYEAADVHNFRANIVQKFLDRGMHVSFDGERVDSNLNAQLTQLEHNLHADALEQSPDIDNNTAAELEEKDVKSEQDSIQLERYRYRDALKLPPVAMFKPTSAAIRHAFDHDLLPKLSAWRTALADDEILLERATRNAQGHDAMFRADLHQYGALQGLTRERYQQALRAAGIDVTTLCRHWQFKLTYPMADFDASELPPLLNTSYTKHSPTVKAWASWAKNQPWLELPDDFDSNPVQHLNDTLRSLGLTISSKQVRRKTLDTPYLDMLEPLQDGGMMTAKRTKTGKVKRFDITYQAITGKADTRKVDRLLEHGALTLHADDTVTLDLERLRTRFSFEGNTDRVSTYEVKSCEVLSWLFDPRGAAEQLPSKNTRMSDPPYLYTESEGVTNSDFLSTPSTEQDNPPVVSEPDAPLTTLADFETAVNQYRARQNLVPLRFKNADEIQQALPYYLHAIPAARGLLERAST